MEKMLIIGIAGGSGSGKTTIAEKLKARFGEDISVLTHDSYYKRTDGLTQEERAVLNYDCPDSLETDLMVSHINALKRGEPISCPIYDFTVHNRSSEVRIVYPTKVLLLDGILVLADPELRECMDIKIFVDTPDDIRILRRIKRDVNKRGRSLESVINQYLTTVRPMHEMYVAPSRKYADIIIPEGGRNVVAMDMLETRVRNHLAGE